MRRKIFCRPVLWAVLLSVLTACARAGTPGSTGAQETGDPENQGDLETERGAASGENVPGTASEATSGEDMPEAVPGAEPGEDMPGTASPELPQPYARYLDVLEQIRTEGHDPNGEEYTLEESWDFENNCFAIADVDLDGKQELLFNFNESYMSEMREVVYAYDEETDALREELTCWVSTAYYGNGIVKVEMSHNHGKDPEGRGVWPYMVYEYDAEEDCYQLRYIVDSWDGRIHEEDFPDELDVNGDRLLYCVTEENADTAGNEDVMVFDWEEYSAWAEEWMSEWCRTDVVYHPMEEGFAEKVQSAYVQAAAYAAQAAVWFVGEEAGVSCGYLLYDLDGDGSLELVTSFMQGSGRYSENHFYGLSDSGEVTELELVRLCDSEERDWLADFDIGGVARPPAYQDSEGTIYYEGNDYTREGIYGGYEEDGFYYLREGVVYQDSIRQREQFFDREDGGEDEIHYYSMEADAAGDAGEITAEQYEEIREEYVRGMMEARVYQNWVYFQWDEITQGNISEETICMKLFESALGSGCDSDWVLFHSQNASFDNSQTLFCLPCLLSWRHRFCARSIIPNLIACQTGG